MYKHLQPFIDLLFFLSTRDIREQVFYLALAAMFSTGIFDSDTSKLGHGSYFYLGLSEFASAAFSLFLQQASFHVLFPAIMNIEGPYLLEPSKVQQLLLSQLSEQTIDHLVLPLRHRLSWIHWMQSHYRIRPLGELKHLFLKFASSLWRECWMNYWC